MLKDEDANDKFIDPTSPCEYNKYAFSLNYGAYLTNLFIALNSPDFIKYLEKITGIENLITNDISLKGAGIHRIKNGGYLQLHTHYVYNYK
jgi:hypothetical protein